MSLRGLGSLLGRRFSPRGIPHARVQAQAEVLGLALHRPIRSVHNLRDLNVGDGAIGALAAVGGIAAGILYSNRDKSSLEVTGKETTNFVDMKRPPVDDPAIRAKFMDEAGKVAWLEYLDYINFRMLHPEVSDKKVHDEMIEMIQRRYVKTEELEDMSVDEPAMKARFEEWKKQFGRTYKNEEEEAMRHELFKVCAIGADKTNASSGTSFAPNDLADWTHEELYGPCYQEEDSFWEEYFKEISRMYAEGRVKGYPRTVGTDKVGWIDAAKQWYKILKARKTGLDAARKAEQAAATRKTKGEC